MFFRFIKKLKFVLQLLILFFPLQVFSENGSLQKVLEDSVDHVYWEEHSVKTEFETTVEVSAECSYPYFCGNSSLINYVNKNVEFTATGLFRNFVEYEKTSSEEYDKGFGGCFFECRFVPVCCFRNLISIYGFESQTRACPHGWTRYKGKNFWQKEREVVELSLEDLFVKDSNWREFIINYCENYFKSVRYGYYAIEYGFEPELEANDLRIFLLTKKGLMIIFESYKVGGWADGPDMVIIPYQKIKNFIDPNGPLRGFF